METSSALLAICAGNSPVTGEFPLQRPVTRSYNVFFHLRMNKRLINNREAGDLRRYCAHYDVTVVRRIAKENLKVHVQFTRAIRSCDCKISENYQCIWNVLEWTLHFINNAWCKHFSSSMIYCLTICYSCRPRSKYWREGGLNVLQTHISVLPPEISRQTHL